MVAHADRAWHLTDWESAGVGHLLSWCFSFFQFNSVITLSGVGTVVVDLRLSFKGRFETHDTYLECPFWSSIFTPSSPKYHPIQKKPVFACGQRYTGSIDWLYCSGDDLIREMCNWIQALLRGPRERIEKEKVGHPYPVRKDWMGEYSRFHSNTVQIFF
jgi:hypothetical protein